MLKRHEGLSLKVYRCPAGHNTIGYGWNLDAHALPYDIAAYLRLRGEIDDWMAERLLTISMASAEQDCREIYPGFDSFAERRKAALTDFLFNCGARVALTFREMRAAIFQENWARAAEEMQDSKWFKQVGSRSAELCEMIRNG